MDKCVSIVVPVYNEEKRIKGSVEKIEEYFSNNGWLAEVILVDDGSKDGTEEETKALLKMYTNLKVLKNGKNSGKGFSIKRGVELAKGEYILFTDADLSTPIEEIDKLMKHINEADVVIGSRAMDGSRVIKQQPFYRTFSGKMFNYLVQLLVVKGIKDTQCGFKLFNAKQGKSIFSNIIIKGFAFDVEAIMIAKKLGYKTKEVPVKWENSNKSELNMYLDPIRMGIDLLIIWFRSVFYRPVVVGGGV